MKTRGTFKARSAFVALAAVTLVGVGSTAAVSATSYDQNGQHDSNYGQHQSYDYQQSSHHDNQWNQYGGRGADDGMQKHDWTMFDKKYNEYKQMYEEGVSKHLNMAYAQMGDGDKKPLYDFYAKHEQYSMKMDEKMQMAKDQYDKHMQAGMDKHSAHNMFIDEYNNVKAEYFNYMEMAKNQMAGEMDKAGYAMYKDEFMNHYNAYKDMYGQKMEMLKNEW